MLEYMSPNVAAFWRFLFAVVGLYALMGKSLPSPAVVRLHIGGVLLVGFVGLFGFIFFFTQGLNETSAVNGALILALNPAMTVLLAVIFQGHKIRPKDIVGMVLALVGVIYLLTGGQIMKVLEIRFAVGDLYFLIACVMFALQNIWIRKYSAALGGKAFTLLTNFFCLTGFAVLLVADAGPAPTELPGRFWVATLAMGLPGTALAYYSWIMGVKQLGPARAAIFMNAIPLMVAVFAVPFGSELYGFHFVSFVLIVSGLLLMQQVRR